MEDGGAVPGPRGRADRDPDEDAFLDADRFAHANCFQDPYTITYPYSDQNIYPQHNAVSFHADFCHDSIACCAENEVRAQN